MTVELSSLHLPTNILLLIYGHLSTKDEFVPCLIPHQGYMWGMGGKFLIFLTLALDELEWSASCFGLYSP
jgi:hypothetical protein